MHETVVEVPIVKWDNTLEAKQELQKTVQYPVEHPYKFLKHHMSPLKGVLYCGLPCRVRLSLLRRLRTRHKQILCLLRVRNCISKWCEMLIDDLDSTAKARGGSDADRAFDRALSQILKEMDGMNTEKEVFIIGATNQLGTGHVHPTLLRPGDSGDAEEKSCDTGRGFNFLAQHTHGTKFRTSLWNTLRRQFLLAAQC